MLKFTPRVRPSQQMTDGSFRVRLELKVGDVRTSIATSIKIASPIELFDGEIVNRPDADLLNARLQGEISFFTQTLNNTEGIDGFTDKEISNHMRNAAMPLQRSIDDVFGDFAAEKKLTASDFETQRASIHDFEQFIGEPPRAIAINQQTLQLYKQQLKEKMLPTSVINQRIKTLEELREYAGTLKIKDEAENEAVVPDVSIPTQLQNTQNAESSEPTTTVLTPEQIREIYNLKNLRQNERKIRDLFIFAYIMGGMTRKELINTNFNIGYIRKRTTNADGTKVVKIPIPDHARKLINSYIDRDGRIFFTALQRKDGCISTFNNQLASIARRIGVEPFSFDSAHESYKANIVEKNRNWTFI